MARAVPLKLYFCPECSYSTPQRFVLKNHLDWVHGYTKNEARVVAAECEYFLRNPTYARLADEDEDEADNEEF